MSIFNHLLDNSEQFLKIIKAAKDGLFPLHITGTCDAQKAHMISSVCEVLKKNAFVVTHSESAAKRLYKDLSFFSEMQCVYIPPKDVVLFDVDAAGKRAENERAYALSRLSENNIGIASIESFLQLVPAKEAISGMRFTINEGDKIDLTELTERLVKMGYSRDLTIDAEGMFAVRGGIVDIFPPGNDSPVRMELFGDDVDSLRLFDCDTQLSRERIISAEIIPVHIEDEESSLFSYIGASSLLFWDEPVKINESAQAIHWELQENIKTLTEKGVKIKDKKFLLSYDEALKTALSFGWISFSSIGSSAPGFKPVSVFSLSTKNIGSYSGNISFFISDISNWLEEGRNVIVLGGSTSRAVKIREMLTEHSIRAVFSQDIRENVKGTVFVTTGSIVRGFEYPEEKIVILSDNEIFSSEKKIHGNKKSDNLSKISNASQLEIGDYVVHRIHGIGKYLGITRMKVGGVSKDYIKIEYRGEDFLYLPVGQLDAVGKYTGGNDGAVVRLNKMGSDEWLRARRKVKESVEEMAKRLVSLYAERENSVGVSFSPDTTWQRQFEDSFPYEETEDQLRSTEEMKRDMESTRPMDRLLCGDVGYGKTEVAMRGAFKAVMDGYQVAYLVPTTILASQHYNNFVERMKDFPITIRLLSRFSKPSESKKTLEMMKNGECDIVVGTHKLLSKNVEFKKLGFLIVDEEQRFGVTHKEKIKEMKKNVDVLTLSATPIPRTLHMAMIGIRDMSVLSMPPDNRYPVQTYVLEYSESILAHAMEREISRGGQVYFLHNRIETIFKQADRVQSMLPNARIGVAHGRMSETELENVMVKVDRGEIDILVCTTIIETGLDIPNVNTIIIENADTLGLSQLYQLRGRVGRTNRSSYAYFTYKKNKVLDETAEKRLRAISDFTEFGSGFRIAMRDLEIRGAGNILGPEQHGFMLTVGYDMYCKILEEAINDAKGIVQEEKETETSVDINVNAFIPESYIPSSALRIDAYKKIASIEDIQDRYKTEEEFEDRYGDIPKETMVLLDIQMLRVKAGKIGITEISQTESGIVFKLQSTNEESISRIGMLASKMRGKILFGAGNKPYILLREKNPSSSEVCSIIENVLNELTDEEDKNDPRN